MTTPTDDDVERLRKAFERHYGALLSYARRRTACREDAEEIVSSTFATAWRRIDRLPPEPLTIAWLYRVAWRTLANHHRSLRRRTNLVSRLMGLRGDEQLPVAAEDDGLVLDALERLRPGDQEVLRLVTWEELSYLEAAATIGCSPNAFAIRLHRARKALRAELDRLDPRWSSGEEGSDQAQLDD